ncbi:MAG: hypothetical protein K2V38_13650 [Gemmataceae bacterium]|nr:hypothetical protein [Gemmataceae bacterium]
MTPALRDALRAVYAEVDAAVAEANPRCDASGRCCRFTEFGHTLFISAFEAEILLAHAPAYPQPVAADGCPFQVGGLCTQRDNRPLGCRIFFCDPAFEARMGAITESALARLKRLADAHGTGWNYAPLHHFLNAPRSAPDGPAADTMTPPATRMPLPVVPS